MYSGIFSNRLAFYDKNAMTAASDSDVVAVYNDTLGQKSWIHSIEFSVKDFAAQANTTIKLKLQDSDDGKTFADLTPSYETKALAAADFAKLNKPLRIALPTYRLKKYLRLQYSIAAGTVTGGEMTAWLSGAFDSGSPFDYNFLPMYDKV